MKRVFPIILLLIVGVLGVFMTLMFSNRPSTIQDSPQRLQVVTSILPVKTLVKRIGQDYVDVVSLVPAGASVHTYEPTPAQLRTVAEADLFVKVGTPIEFEVAWLQKLLSTNNHVSVADLSQGIDLISSDEEEHADEDGEVDDHHHEGGVDPHIWLSPKNMQAMVVTVADALSQLDPNHAQDFEEQKQILLTQLQQIDQEIESSLNHAANKQLIVYHDAWGYFARDYQLTLLAIEDNEKEPTAKRIQDVITLAKQQNVKVIFASPEFNTQSAEVIAHEVGAEVVLLSPLPEDIFSAFTQIGDAFIKAF